MRWGNLVRQGQECLPEVGTAEGIACGRFEPADVEESVVWSSWNLVLKEFTLIGESWN